MGLYNLMNRFIRNEKPDETKIDKEQTIVIARHGDGELEIGFDVANYYIPNQCWLLNDYADKDEEFLDIKPNSYKRYKLVEIEYDKV